MIQFQLRALVACALSAGAVACSAGGGDRGPVASPSVSISPAIARAAKQPVVPVSAAIARAREELMSSHPKDEASILQLRAVESQEPDLFSPMRVKGRDDLNRRVDAYIDAVDREHPGYRLAHIRAEAKLRGQTGAVTLVPRKLSMPPTAKLRR